VPTTRHGTAVYISLYFNRVLWLFNFFLVRTVLVKLYIVGIRKYTYFSIHKIYNTNLTLFIKVKDKRGTLRLIVNYSTAHQVRLH